VESLDRSFENVCELDLVFHFDEVHHILAEIIQGGVVLETNVDEIDDCSTSTSPFNSKLGINLSFVVQRASTARKDSFASANPLYLGNSLGSRNSNLKSPLGWLTERITGVGAR